MKVALIASYDKLIQGLGITADSDNLDKLTACGWGKTQNDALKATLGAIQAAEHSLHASTHELSERISEAQELLKILDSVFVMSGLSSISPSSESSFRYSTSMSSSSSLPWRYNSGSVWVTTTSSCAVPEISGLPGPVELAGASPSKHAVKKPAKSKSGKTKAVKTKASTKSKPG